MKSLFILFFTIFAMAGTSQAQELLQYVDGSWTGAQDCNALQAFPSGTRFYPAHRACTVTVQFSTDAVRYGTDLLGEFTYDVTDSAGGVLMSHRGRYWAARTSLHILMNFGVGDPAPGRSYPFGKIFANGLELQIGDYDTFLDRTSSPDQPGDLEQDAVALVDSAIDFYSWLSIADGYDGVKPATESFTDAARDFRDAVVAEESRSTLRRLLVALEDEFIRMRRAFFLAHSEAYDPDVEAAFDEVKVIFDRINNQFLLPN